MERDQRVDSNWALLRTLEISKSLNIGVAVAFCLAKNFGVGGTLRRFSFLRAGLQQVEARLRKLNIPFYLLHGEAPESLPDFLRSHRVSHVVCDLHPLRQQRRWTQGVVRACPEITFEQVDAHNIVPLWQASPKQEYAARTIRPKIARLLPQFLTPFPPVEAVTGNSWEMPQVGTAVDWDAAEQWAEIDRTVGAADAAVQLAGAAAAAGAEAAAAGGRSTVKEEAAAAAGSPSSRRRAAAASAAVKREVKVKAKAEAEAEAEAEAADGVDGAYSYRGPIPGEEGARAALLHFAAYRLPYYALRNDPVADAQSGLSPYLNLGQLSAQEAARAVLPLRATLRGEVDSFLEELIVRRELSDNFCWYSAEGGRPYDGLQGAPQWAQTSLALHAADDRPYVYSEEQLEGGRTHDELWNAAQRQMVREGRMHGYMRMFWAKKILEWTCSPEEALRIALRLNDKYSLDGCDPNSVVGVMWSVAGVHDQGWRERPVLGKIRYMNAAGCRRKFDTEAYIARFPPTAATSSNTPPLQGE